MLRRSIYTKSISKLMAAVMVFTGIALTAAPARKIKADTQTMSVSLGADAIKPLSGAKWEKGGTRVYFGKYSDKPVEYRVLKAEDGKILLDCDTTLYTSKIGGTAPDTGKWAGSTLQTELNGSDFYNKTGVFNTVEKNAIKLTSNKGTEGYYSFQSGGGSSSLQCKDYDSNDYVFLLSAQEITDLYSIQDRESRAKNSTNWWTRSHCSSTAQGIYVNSSGTLANAMSINAYGISPAFNIDESAIAFTSNVSVGRPSSLTLTAESSSTEWLLALNDGTGFNASLAGESSVEAGSTISVSVSSNASGNSNNYTQISALLVDANGNVAAYGKVSEVKTGAVAVAIPSGVAGGSYTLKLFDEAVLDASSNLTSYVSNMTDLSITVTAKQTEKETEKQTEPATEKETEKETVKQTEAATEKETVKQTEPATEKETEKQTEPATEKETVKQTEAATEKETVKQTEPATEKETEKQTEAATESETVDTTKNHWETVNGAEYWYENGVRQGVKYNDDGTLDTSYRGKEVYDSASDAWYWLDNIQNGAKTVSKDVYQESSAGVCADDAATGTGKWVRYDENGHMVKGWSNDGNYYFDLTYGTMIKGYYTIRDIEYFFDTETGVLQSSTASGLKGYTGWKKVGGVDIWYEDGQRQGYSKDTRYRGKEIYDPASNAWYWLDNVDSGKKAVSKDVYQESLAGDWGDIDNGDGIKIGKWVRYDANGHMMKGWCAGTGADAVSITGPSAAGGRDVYYFDYTYGTMAKGTVEIDGVRYTFDEQTGILVK